MVVNDKRFELEVNVSRDTVKLWTTKFANE